MLQRQSSAQPDQLATLAEQLASGEADGMEGAMGRGVARHGDYEDCTVGYSDGVIMNDSTSTSNSSHFDVPMGMNEDFKRPQSAGMQRNEALTIPPGGSGAHLQRPQTAVGQLSDSSGTAGAQPPPEALGQSPSLGRLGSRARQLAAAEDRLRRNLSLAVAGEDGDSTASSNSPGMSNSSVSKGGAASTNRRAPLKQSSVPSSKLAHQRRASGGWEISEEEGSLLSPMVFRPNGVLPPGAAGAPGSRPGSSGEKLIWSCALESVLCFMQCTVLFYPTTRRAPCYYSTNKEYSAP